MRPYRLEDIERVATDHVNHIEGYAKGLVARAKLDTAQEQVRKALKNRRESNEVQDWMFWNNQWKLYKAKEREATEELSKMAEPIDIGQNHQHILRASATAVATFRP